MCDWIFFSDISLWWCLISHPAFLRISYQKEGMQILENLKGELQSNMNIDLWFFEALVNFDIGEGINLFEVKMLVIYRFSNQYFL